jgi:tetratricopeptide (TPR) repeat protein
MAKTSANRVDPDLICLIVLLAFGLVAYSNSFVAAFHLDDTAHILKNDALFNLAKVDKIYAYCKERFLTYFTLAINYKISKFDATSYHIFNFFIHYIAAFFLYFLFIETWKTPALRGSSLKFSKRLAAFLVAAIFLLHPLQTEAVTYVTQRAESMAGMFYLGTLFFYLRARLSLNRRSVWGYYVSAIVCALGAAFSKETSVTLPVMIVIFEVFLFNTSIKDLLRHKIVLILFIPAGLIVAYKLKPLIQQGFFYDSEISFTRKEYLLTQFSVLVTYLRLFFWPAEQNLDWDYPLSTNFFQLKTVSSFLFLLVLLLVALLAYRKFRLLSLGIVAFFVILAPTSSVIPIKDLIFEHRMYLPLAFLAMGFVQILFDGLIEIKKMGPRASQIALMVITITLLPLLTSLTHARNEVWMSEISLWRDVVKKSPNKARAHINYGKTLLNYGYGSNEEVKKEFTIASRLCPDCTLPYYNLAIVYFREGDYQNVLRHALKVEKKNPNNRYVLYLVAKTYMKLDKWQEARIYLERLVKLSPGSKFLLAYINLIEVYLKLNLPDKAAEIALATTRLSDDMPRVDYYRGMAFYRLNNLVRARFYFAKQIEHESERTQAYLMLAQVHYLNGEYREAERALRQVLVEDRWSAATHYNLAIILERKNSFEEAIKHLEKARAVAPLSLGISHHLCRLYDQPDDAAKRLELMRNLLNLRPASAEFAFLKANKERNLDETLRQYAEEFLVANPSPASERSLAIIASLREDYPKAIARYQRYLQTINKPGEKERIEKEMNRLEGILNNKEPLEIP